MPWSYRRSRKVGPFRINFSKGGIGYSMGNKYLRYGKTAKGRSYISSAPVTGLRYQQTLSTTGGGRGKSRGSSTSPLVSHPAYNPAAAEIMTAESDRLIAQSEWIASESERIQRMLANPNLTDRERSVLDSALEASTERSKQITEQLREQTERLNAQSAQLRAQSMVPAPVYYAPPPQQQSRGRGRGCLIPVGIIIGLLILLTSLNSTTGGKATSIPLATAVRTIAPATSAPMLQATAASSLSLATLAPSTTPSPATPAPTTTPQIVTVKEDAVNLRAAADVGSAVVTLVPPGTDATVIGEDTTGPDGVTRYVHARVGSNEGYLRSDLVSTPHVVTPAPPTPIPPTAAPDFGAEYPLIDPTDLSKRPDYYKGKRFSVIGKAFNVHESNGVTTFQMQAEVSEYNTVAVVLTFNGTSSGLQDNVRLRAYCVGAGSVSGTNAFGGNVTEPAMLAVRIGPPETFSSNAAATAFDATDSAAATKHTQDSGNSRATGAANFAATNVGATAAQQKQNAAITSVASTSQAFIGDYQTRSAISQQSSDATIAAVVRSGSGTGTAIALTYTPKPTPKP